ncbi:RNA methyltransferase [Candidatus Poribacteria bacterium]|nr:RNA methyltransferase [Candidatus Poribacteria bacterium]
MINYNEIIAFLEKKDSDADAVSRFKEAYHTFCKTGTWSPAYQVFATGWQRLDGVMLLEPEDTYDSDYRVHLTTKTERSLRELLLAFPRRYRGLFHLKEKWIENRIHDVLEGDVIQTDTGSFYRGIKRGSSTRAEQRTVSKRKDTRVSHIRKLTSLKGKLEHSEFIIEGHLIVERAVADGLPIEALLYTTGFVATPEGKALLTRAASENLSSYQVNDGVMGSITTTRPVPPIIASVHLSYPNFLSASGSLNFHFSPKCVLLIAENIGNPDNLGMTLRTADAAGVSAVLLSGGGASPFHKNCIRASRGAVGRLPLFYTPDIGDAIDALRVSGWQVLGATASAKNQLHEKGFTLPTAIVVGNENTGLSTAARDDCTDLVRIPMASGQSSLNVGVAAGILLYELTRQHRI